MNIATTEAGERPVCWITGAGSGIGQATTWRLVSAGYDVVALDRDEAGLEETVRRTQQGVVIPITVDLSDVPAIERAISALLERFGVPDAVVNNAGVGVAGSVAETSSAEWDQTIAVNLSAVFHLCRLIVPGMVERGRGVIVNVASVAGVVGLRNRAAYCASKAGVIGLTRALAADHANQGLRVNAICPGTVETAWIDRIIAGADDRVATRAAMAARQLDGRMGTADEVAGGIAFLLSPEARFMNGSALVMDGGLSAV